jgi:hypothetical protein
MGTKPQRIGNLRPAVRPISRQKLRNARRGANGATRNVMVGKHNPPKKVKRARRRASRRRLRAEPVTDIGVQLPSGLDQLRIGVGKGDVKFIFDFHNQFDGVEAHGRSFDSEC